MKLSITLAIALLISIPAFAEKESEALDVSDIRAKYEAQYKAWLDAYEREYEENLADQRRQNDEFSKQMEESREMLELQRQLLDGAAENEKRFGKILDRWERQQYQYQKYLDRLTSEKE